MARYKFKKGIVNEWINIQSLEPFFEDSPHNVGGKCYKEPSCYRSCKIFMDWCKLLTSPLSSNLDVFRVSCKTSYFGCKTSCCGIRLLIKYLGWQEECFLSRTLSITHHMQCAKETEMQLWKNIFTNPLNVDAHVTYAIHAQTA